MDGDGYGVDVSSVEACEKPGGYADVGGDCRDDDTSIYPGASEICDDVDNNCDGNIDEGLATATYYADNDGDGYGAEGSSLIDCVAPEGYVDDSTDCDDENANVNPAATEICNEVDDNCDGEVDEDCFASCLEVLERYPDAADGLYRLDPLGDGGFDAYCDLTSGGWTLIMKALEDNFAYDDPLWGNDEVENPDDYDFTALGTRAKYPAFNSVPFSEIRTSDADDFELAFSYDLGARYTSARGLFEGAGISISKALNPYLDTRETPNMQSWGCTQYIDVGINQRDYLGTAALGGGSYCDWNGGARFGQRVNACLSLAGPGACTAGTCFGDDVTGDCTGNHMGHGWGNYSTIDWHFEKLPRDISQLLWVR